MQYTAWMTTARRQGGVLSRAQCLQAGLGKQQIEHLITRGALVKLGHGVYRILGAPAREDAALWHAALATGGTVMGAAAAFAWQLIPELPERIEVLLPPGRRINPPSQVTMRRLVAETGELTTRFHLPVTTRTRTVLDCAAFDTVANSTAFVDRALSQHWVSLRDVERRLERPVAGNRRVRRVLRTHLAGAEAESERRLHRLLRQAGIAGWVPTHEVSIGGHTRARIDVAFPHAKLAIEVDGLAYHSDVVRFQRDRTRQNDLVSLGWTVLRFTWSDIVDRPAYVLAVIRRQLAILESYAS